MIYDLKYNKNNKQILIYYTIVIHFNFKNIRHLLIMVIGE